MRDFRTLKVWENAHYLTLEIYKATATFPRNELYGLTSQMRRSSVSIPANIAEGCGRGSNSDLARFLQIAFGSASELEYHLLLAHDLGFIDDITHGQLTTQVTEIKRMLSSLIKKVRINN